MPHAVAIPASTVSSSVTELASGNAGNAAASFARASKAVTAQTPVGDFGALFREKARPVALSNQNAVSNQNQETAVAPADKNGETINPVVSEGKTAPSRSGEAMATVPEPGVTAMPSRAMSAESSAAASNAACIVHGEIATLGEAAEVMPGPRVALKAEKSSISSPLASSPHKVKKESPAGSYGGENTHSPVVSTLDPGALLPSAVPAAGASAQPSALRGPSLVLEGASAVPEKSDSASVLKSDAGAGREENSAAPSQALPGAGTQPEVQSVAGDVSDKDAQESSSAALHSGHAAAVPAATGPGGKDAARTGETAIAIVETSAGSHASGVNASGVDAAALAQPHLQIAGVSPGAGAPSTAVQTQNLYDRIDQGTPPVVLQSGPQHVAVGVRDPDLGWVEIKTQNVAGHVDAALVTASGQTHASLAAHLPAMAEFLAGRDVRVGTLSVHQQMSGTNTGSGQNNGSGANGQSGGYGNGAANPGSEGQSSGSGGFSHSDSGGALHTAGGGPGYIRTTGVSDEAQQMRPLSYISVRA
jgi:hypothetical protein